MEKLNDLILSQPKIFDEVEKICNTYQIKDIFDKKGVWILDLDTEKSLFFPFYSSKICCFLERFIKLEIGYFEDIQFDCHKYIDPHYFLRISWMKKFADDYVYSREEGPAYISVILWHNGCFQIKEIWYKEGLKHRDDDKPSFYEFNEKGDYKEKYHFNGLLHRERDPASIYCKSGKKMWVKKFFVNGKEHRDNGPSYIHKNYNNMYISFHQNGELKASCESRGNRWIINSGKDYIRTIINKH